MLLQKKVVSILIFGFFLGRLETAYGGSKLSEVFPEQGISDAWTVEKISRDYGDVYVVDAAYPKAPRSDGTPRTALDYGPNREEGKVFNCAVLSQKPQKDGNFGKILDAWVQSGISSHYFVGQDGISVEWINPLTSKGQMAGKKWNNMSVEILLLTDAEQKASEAQIKILGDLFGWLKAKPSSKIDVQYMGSHQEARGSGDDGKINNITDVRKELGLDLLPK